VHGRPSAPHVVVIHAGEVVMHEGIRVDDFDCRGEGTRITLAPRSAVRGKKQDGAKALPFPRQRVRNGVTDSRRKR
jgi:hypothetical protein